MQIKRMLAALLAAGLVLTLSACRPKSRRPELPAAPLQPSFSGQAASAQQKTAAQALAEEEAPQTPIEELLDCFVSPPAQAGALYQDYITAHREAYKALRSRPEETMRAVLPELLEEPGALACYTDETSRQTLLYCLMKDILQDEPFCWDGDGYRYISDMLAEYTQYVSGRVLEAGEEALAEDAPLTALCAELMKEKPALRLNMTACGEMVNAQVLTNAKLVFAAALEGRDAERYGFESWPENLAAGFGAQTSWTLSQSEDTSVCLTAADPQSGKSVTMCYSPNQAERESLFYGYGALLVTKQDGEELRLNSQSWDMAYTPATAQQPVQDDELVLENGVELGMDYNTVCALLGQPDRVWSDTMAGMGVASRGVSYSFCYDESFIMRLESISFRYAEDTWLGETSVLPVARGIALGDSMQSVFDRLPTLDPIPKKWAIQQIYGWDEPEKGQAELQFVADSFYALNIRTPGGQSLSVTFARLDNTVKWMDLSSAR